MPSGPLAQDTGLSAAAGLSKVGSPPIPRNRPTWPWLVQGLRSRLESLAAWEGSPAKQGCAFGARRGGDPRSIRRGLLGLPLAAPWQGSSRRRRADAVSWVFLRRFHLSSADLVAAGAWVDWLRRGTQPGAASKHAGWRAPAPSWGWRCAGLLEHSGPAQAPPAANRGAGTRPAEGPTCPGIVARPAGSGRQAAPPRCC